MVVDNQLKINEMTTINLTQKELEELCFSLMQDSIIRAKTNQKSFELGRRKLLNELKKIEQTNLKPTK